MGVNHYDNLDMKTLSFRRNNKAPSFTKQPHVKINL